MITDAQLRAALAAHSEATQAWGETILAMLRRLTKQVAGLEGRVGRLERRANARPTPGAYLP